MQVADALDSIRAAGADIVGPRTHPTSVDEGTRTLAVVDEDPQALADQAGLELDAYALARMVSSEEGSGSAEVLLALAETARNEAQRRGISVSRLLLSSKFSASDGKFSEQLGKWASTRLAPNARHVAAAEAALSGTDFVRGAVDFFDPSSQDRGTQAGHKLSQTSEDYIAARARDGLGWVGPLDGVNAYHLMLFAPGEVDMSGAMAVLAEGRRTGSSGLVTLLLLAAGALALLA